MAIIELVDFNDVSTNKPKKTKKVVKEKAKVKKEVVEEIVEEAKVEEVEEVEVVEKNDDTIEVDDLTKIEGIGPKISQILKDSDISTFAGLAQTNVEKISEILAEAGNRYKSHDPQTWPEQAKMAADGNWDELKKWQDDLDGGIEKG